MGRPGYREFHGFKRTVFGRGIATKHLLDYVQAQELAGEFSTLIEDGGIGVLIGEVGIGKTTAFALFLMVQKSGRARSVTRALANIP